MKEINRQLNEKEYLEYIEQWKLENKELIKSGKCKKCFIECLPRYENGNNKDQINWYECTNYTIHFIYNNIEDDLVIINRLDTKYLKIKVKYKDKEFEITTDRFKGCCLAYILEERTSEFRIEIGTRFQDDKRDITIIDRKKEIITRENGIHDERKYYKYKCNKCGFNGNKHYSSKDKEYKDEYWILESGLVKGVGCACCGATSYISVENINSIYKTDPWMIPIIGEECAKTHTHGSKDKVEVTCPDCNKKRNVKLPINKIYAKRTMCCPKCGDGYSYPNKMMFNILTQLNIEFIPEYSPDWIGLRKYDFYIPSINLIIEMDGELGHGNRMHKNSKITKEESLEIDIYKDEQARLHSIEVIRIDCIICSLDYIKMNIENKLSNYLKIQKVNWLKVEEFALSNRVKEACDLWSNGIRNTDQIGKIMKIHYATISKYLNKGARISWCDYNPIQVQKDNGRDVGLLRSEPIICIDTEQIFISSQDCSRKSINTFGTKLGQSNISLVCNGKQDNHKGLKFKKIKDLTKEEYGKYDIENKLKELNKSA